MIFIIYKVQILEEIYIGSTTNFRKRQLAHKYACHNPNSNCHNNKKYQVIRENGGWSHNLMTEIEQIDCETKSESRIREEYWIGFYNASLNSIRAFCTIEERKEQDRIRQSRYYSKEDKSVLKKKYQREKYQTKKHQASICSLHTPNSA